MNFEKRLFESSRELEPQIKIEVKFDYESFVPEEFKQDPLGYFESRGKNIKPGEIKRDENSTVREDPTAVKGLPTWIDTNGNELDIIGKKVNIQKGKVGESGDPFYEYNVMEIISKLGLPTAKPIAKVEQLGIHLIIMEKVQGISWYEKDTLHLQEKGYSEEDITILTRQAEEQMTRMQTEFEKAGIQRSWKLKDMIFDIDIENKTIRKITPVDWERTKIDQAKLERYKTSLS